MLDRKKLKSDDQSNWIDEMPIAANDNFETGLLDDEILAENDNVPSLNCGELGIVSEAVPRIPEEDSFLVSDREGEDAQELNFVDNRSSTRGFLSEEN
jgi:hypothetical protein